MSSQIRFEPNNVDGLVAAGTTVAAAAERLGVHIELACGGHGECDSCRVVLVENPLSLSPLTEAEQRRLTAEQILASTRLACQARIGDGDCVVRVPTVTERATEAHAGGATSDTARERIRETFASMPTGDRIAAIVEMQLQVASDLLGALVETPLRIGEQLFGSLFKSGSGAAEGEEQNTTKEQEGPAGDASSTGGDSHEQE
jgi:ferredoxin